MILILGACLFQPFAVDAQYSQFSFDLNGNLQSQKPASLASPIILSQPQDQVGAPGELASFFVVATDTRGLTYQWRRYGTNINSGATSDALLLTNISVLDQGSYAVVLSNSSGSVTSAPAMLWIDSDRDGLPDAWEQTYFGGLAQNSTSDFDGDGISNFTEFNDGTIPTNNASALFRLTVMSDGGFVTLSPTKLAYTNGELVTATVTPYGSEVFQIWTGDIFSQSNPLSLVMTNNKTLFAHFGGIPFAFTNAAGGDWHNPTNWSPNLVPSAVDDVTSLPAATITINAPAACHDITFTSSTLTGTGDLSIHGNALWTGGTLSGSGKTIIATNAALIINNSFNLNLNRTLENAGTITWFGTAGLFIDSAVITNRPGAIFNLPNTATFNTSAGSPRFDNAGTFRKSANGGTTLVNIAFNNYGTLDLQTGTLQQGRNFGNAGSVILAPGTTHRLTAGGSSTGIITNPASSVVEWTGGTFTLDPSAQLLGPGTYRINTAFNCNTDITVQNLELTSTFSGSGNLTIGNAMSWTGGTLGGTGRTIIPASATLTINSGFNINLNRTLENRGTTLWPGGAGLYFDNGVITNCSGALFHVQNAASFNTSAGSPRFDNAGTFRRSANSGTFLANIAFNNYGSMDIQTGTLQHGVNFLNTGSVVLGAGTTQRLNQGGSSTGPITVPATSLLELAGGTFTLDPGAQLLDAGTYRILATLNCNTNALIQNLEFSGTLGGSGDVTVSNAMTWSGGTLGGAGRLTISTNATLTINSGFNISLNRALENANTILWTGGGGLFLNNGVITNRLGALFHVQNASSFNNSAGSRFDNAGTFRKSANGGTVFVFLPFNNYGSMDIQAGTLQQGVNFVNSGSVLLAAGTTHRFTQGGTSTGTINNPASSLVEWTGGTFNLDPGGQLIGTGTFRVNGATLNFNTNALLQNLDFSGTIGGSGDITISNTMTWGGGVLGGTGRLTISTNAILTINSFFSVNLNRNLENANTILWPGGGSINFNNAVITNRPGALLNIQNAATFGSGGGSPRVDNAGTVRKSVNGGTFGANIPFNNYGNLEIQTGTLQHAANFLNAGSVVLSAGAVHRFNQGGSSSGTVDNPATSLVEWAGGTFTLDPGAQLLGAGTYRLNATLNCNTNVLVQNMDIPSATLGGSGDLTVSNSMTWSGGTWNGSGRTIISTNATLTMGNTFSMILARRLENAGTILWPGSGGLNLANSVITNRPGALFHLQSAAPFAFSSGSPRIDNAGTFRKSANSGTTLINNLPFNNYGIVDIRTGIIAPTSGYSSSSNAFLNCALGGTTAGSGYGQLQVSGAVTLDGGLSVDLLPGYTPVSNDTFTVVSAGTRSGSFSTFSYPANRVGMIMSNSSSAVIVRVTNVFNVPQPVLLNPRLSGPDVQLTWTATSNVTYRLEYLPSMSSTNWTALAGDVTTLSNTASKLDALTSSNRSYRVRVLP